MHRTETTNDRLAIAATTIKQLIEWADTDAQHASEHDAPGVAQDDRLRARTLRKALALIEQCTR